MITVYTYTLVKLLVLCFFISDTLHSFSLKESSLEELLSTINSQTMRKMRDHMELANLITSYKDYNVYKAVCTDAF